MQNLIAGFKTYFGSGYLEYSLWLFAGYVAVYGLAFLLARAGPTNRTIIYRCRRAWTVAFGLHALITCAVTVKWYYQYGYFQSFWSFFPWYLGMLILDGYIIASAVVRIEQFSSYQQ